MYVSVRRYRVDPKLAPEFIRQLIEEFVPLIRELAETVGYFVVEGKGGTLSTITICQTEAGVKKASNRGTDWLKDYFTRNILGQEEIRNLKDEVADPLEGPLHEGILSLADRGVPQEEKERAQEEAISGRSHMRSPELLSVAKVSETLGMGRAWVYRRLRRGEIPSVKMGGTLKVERSDLEEYLKTHHYRPRQEDG